MDAYASRASRADRRIALDRLARARRRRRLTSAEYRRRRQTARRAETVEELQALLYDLGDAVSGRDHWRYGRWRGPVREGRELEIQRAVGAFFLVGGLAVAAVIVYAAVVAVSAWL